MENFINGVKEIVTSANAWLFLLFLSVVLILAIRLIKTGAIKVKTKSLQIGNTETERKILEKQNNLAYSYIMALEPIIDEDDELQHYITVCMLEKVYDEVIKWIIANHMTTTKEYVQLKQEEIVYLISSLAINPKIRSKEFVDRVKEWTKEIIERLVQVRELYGN